jgi:hypothetical protein
MMVSGFWDPFKHNCPIPGHRFFYSVPYDLVIDYETSRNNSLIPFLKCFILN